MQILLLLLILVLFSSDAPPASPPPAYYPPASPPLDTPTVAANAMPPGSDMPGATTTRPVSQFRGEPPTSGGMPIGLGSPGHTHDTSALMAALTDPKYAGPPLAPVAPPRLADPTRGNVGYFSR